MANSKKNTTNADKGKSDSQKNTKEKNDKCAEESNAPDQPLADMNE